ncbi:PDZ domain-containing protein [Geobacter sp. AOG2]|uniref:PDZ domain-containing protein n=1 Tax=Geobacter sp. AOG2 TaxID=1566347 RepID=UPI001CC47DF2|nr:PDZ domain-containing protein [Geobacter sp. AOG2]GFE62773.1 hypothetical protein AOG2_33610 [Geobacter sp. AOG2]
MQFGDYIKGPQSKKPTKCDVLGMAVTEIDQVSALRSGMEMAAGLIVTAVRWGSAADLAGVASGDIISEVDGSPTRSLKDLKKLLAAHDPQTPFRLLFLRIGTWRYFTIPFDEDCCAEKTRPALAAG